MKDSQLLERLAPGNSKYIKESNERFSTAAVLFVGFC